ncbi:DUF3429 domain-containing protein [Geminicoccaceae bacterium 1502E]|nr:DUF3429 domain-containing protein [Geminicoccaceae bacterium 1502E]
MHEQHDDVPKVALLLGWLGVLPFAAALAGIALGDFTAHLANAVLLIYGAVILSFMGGVQWGLAMAAGSGPARYVASVVPALAGWAAVHLSSDGGKLLLAAAFLGLMLHDQRTAAAGEAPAWYPRLRRPLTITVVICLVLGSLIA